MEILLLLLLGLTGAAVIGLGSSSGGGGDQDDGGADEATPDPAPIHPGWLLEPGGDGPAVLRGSDAGESIDEQRIEELIGADPAFELRAMGGNDTILAGFGVMGTNPIYGGAGDDEIMAASRGFAEVFGGEGADTIAAFNTYAYGGGGDDVLTVSPGTLESPRGQLAYGGAGDDLICAPDGVADLYGGHGDDTLLGARGSQLWGEAGDDDLTILDAFSTAHGGAGDDVLRAQLRVEPQLLGVGEFARFDMLSNSRLVLEGGEGADRFIVEVAPEVHIDPERSAPVVMTTITDFTVGQDEVIVVLDSPDVAFATSLGTTVIDENFNELPDIRDQLVIPEEVRFSGLAPASNGQFTDIVFSTGPDSHDLVVRLQGVTGLDPALVRVSTNGLEVQILREPVAA